MHTRIKISILGAITLLTGLVSCQRVIDVQINNAVQPLVIEANLTNTSGVQSVIISKSVSYNNANVFPPVSGAIVSITGPSGIVYQLPEKQAGTYSANFFKARPNGRYVLNVTVDGQSYTATSTMPEAVNLDSLTIAGQNFAGKIVKTVAVNYHDPGGIANQYRYVMYINGNPVKRVFAENDNLTDGRSVTTMLYDAEVDLKTGDKVEVDMQCIDSNMYDYWYALSTQNGNTPADSATPGNPPSNLSNNALGYFSAHTTQRKTAIIP